MREELHLRLTTRTNGKASANETQQGAPPSGRAESLHLNRQVSGKRRGHGADYRNPIWRPPGGGGLKEGQLADWRADRREAESW